jgi:cytochrome c553
MNRKSVLIWPLLAAMTGVWAWADGELPEGEGKQETATMCGSCHGVDLFTSQKHTAADWRTVVNVMVGYGATLTDKEIDTVVAYLAKNYGPGGEDKK